MSTPELIRRVIVFAVSLPLPLLLVAFMYSRNSWRWQELAKSYAAGPNDISIKRKWTNSILYGRGAWNTFTGMTIIGINQDGLRISLLPPFYFFHTPLFFRFGEFDLAPTKWLMQSAVQITMRDDQGLTLIIPQKTAAWIEEQHLEMKFQAGTA